MGTVRAAGGVLWRPCGVGPGDDVEVAVVHRPRYDDWSLPKGKLDRGEHPLLGALREVGEETGSAAVPGRSLGTSAYEVLQDGHLLPKTVRWWAMRAGPGEFAPSDEVDALRWVPPDEAERLLTAGRDVAPLRLLVAAGLGTTTVLLVRHGHAGDRTGWEGDDLDRPLDARGRVQAERLAGVLAAYAPVRVLSAPALRCTDTVRPLAAAGGLTVEVQPALGDAGYAADPGAALDLLRELGRGRAASVVCSQGGAVPGLVRALADADRLDVGPVRARKASVWALSWLAGELVDAVAYPPPA